MRQPRIAFLALVAGCGALGVGTSPTPAGVVPRVGVGSLRRSIDSVVNSPEFGNANWGVLVVTASGDTLYSRNAGKLFMPASNMKLVTAAVALAQLGPDYRYRTAFVTWPRIPGDTTVFTDVIIVGRGDPSVSDHMRHDAMAPLREVADSFAAHGIKRMISRFLPSGNAFPDPVLGFGWSWDDLEEAYSAPTDELLFNEGSTTLTVRAATREGFPARVETSPTKHWPSVVVHALTVPREWADDTIPAMRKPHISVRKDSATGNVIVDGTIALGDSVSAVVTHRDPGVAFAAAFREALIDRGITIVDPGPMPGPPAMTDSYFNPSQLFVDTIAVMVSPPLSEILPAFLKPSQNQIGEMLFKTLGLERDSAGTARAAERVVTRELTEWGARDNGYVIRDGSGLSRYDYLSPETIIHVLDAQRRSPNFSVFYDALPIAGVDGTIRSRMRGTPAENNVRAKTGSFAQARSLSGYVRTLSGDTLMFSVLANNWTVAPHMVEGATDSIAARLASFRRR